MSNVTGAETAMAAPSLPSASTWPLRRVRRIGYLVLGLQLAGFLVWSTVLNNRFTEAQDFEIYHQAWYLIAHGDMYPYSTGWGHYFAQGDSEYGMWLIAPFYWIWPHDVVQLWLQDICIVWAEVMAFTWMCEMAAHRNRGQDASWLAATGLILFVANPWIWWTISFDFHMEPLAIPFVVMLARDLVNGRRRAWIWALLIMAIGAQCAVYVAGVGLGGVFASRRSRATGALMIGFSVGYSALIVLLHIDRGTRIDVIYGYLAGMPAGVTPTLFELVKGIVLHPLGVLGAVWGKRVALLANLMPAGLLGIGSVVVLPLVLVVVLETFLAPTLNFAEPLFQNLPIYIMLPVGTVGVLCWLASRHRRVALLLAGLIVAQCLGWAIVWGPRTSSQWLRVSVSAAATLNAIRSRIPASAEVIASQGVVGGFSDRAVVHALFKRQTVPISRRDTWFVIAPAVGIETLTTAKEMGLIGELAGPLHAKLILHANGVWVFRWHPPAGVHAVTIPGEGVPLLAWESPGMAGRDVMSGPAKDWHVRSNGKKGYVVDGLAWQMPPGQYRASVTMSATGPVYVEVWNDTGNILLTRRIIPETKGIESISLPVNAKKAYQSSSYSGWGPFRADFVAPLGGERLEVRIWSPGAGSVNVYDAYLVHAGG
jgi:hypothetical protein